MPKDGTVTKGLLADAFVGMAGEPGAQVTVKGLVARAGVNRQTFYYHFETMDDLVVYACETKVRPALAAAVGGDGGFAPIVEFADAHRGAARFLLESKGRPWIRGLFYDEAVSMCRARIEQLAGGGVPEAVIADAAVYCTVASASILESWVTGALEGSVDDVVRILERGLEAQARGLALVSGGEPAPVSALIMERDRFPEREAEIVERIRTFATRFVETAKEQGK